MMIDGVAIKHLNTLGINASAQQVLKADSVPALLAGWQHAISQNQPVLLLGGGSNVLFLEDFSGTILLNRLMGIEVHDTDDAWHLHVGAGEDWHGLVCHCLAHGMAGLENLALIPGRVGSAPIQNIGAYGVELRQVCEYVDLLDLNTGEQQRLTAEQCLFGYRESIFKHRYREGYAIIAVGLVLKKQWQPVLNYGDLTQLAFPGVTPGQVFDTVCAMRRSKLPDPLLTGNAGSFFKNPVVDADSAAVLLQRYPDAPHYPQPEGTQKLAAGWLIDRCELKGYQLGGAAVHDRQALVLINRDRASGSDIAKLARYVRQQVAERFNVWLEPEVRFIGANGEVDAVEELS